MKVLALISALFLAANALPFGDELAQSKDFNGKIYAVLVAGSNGWYNYRHQADIYHSYQVLVNHGVDKENIIVFHYDDLAQNEQNPTKGVVINKPGGTDVYHDVPKDYVGADVTPENFLGALNGSAELVKQGKKVLKSGPNDHVFIYFADHGAPDLIAFPSSYLYGEDLAKTLKQLNTDKKYSKLVFYLEACESGSMFNTLLPTGINIYATTAANPTESSYACYYDSARETYLGDVYSVNWIENSDKKSLGAETLLQQFNIVKQETNTSHVQQYGEVSLNDLPLTQFQGDKQSQRQVIGGDERVRVYDAVDSGDVPIHILRNKVAKAQNVEDRQRFTQVLNQLEQGRSYVVSHFEGYLHRVEHLTNSGSNINELLYSRLHPVEPLHRPCYRKLVDTFNSKCLNLNEHPYVLRKLHVFANVCAHMHEQGTLNRFEEAADHLDDYCHQHLSGGYPSRIE